MVAGAATSAQLPRLSPVVPLSVAAALLAVAAGVFGLLYPDRPPT